ncbi:MAG: SDR family NAD(P)-dependent oxidoreductase [Candidatus Tectomicrobia bacterium]|uniref:SDR family NAD(P)-dependent oxidoreductase n=1 Tax=Tectimicrobiota bacterium TaxID=2528274 RepID=A0A938B428_UNCTE|nr:SDR family NAD(P)-dependent oxidoreductase [Candidatus Tectomicrobia bacterium]
MSWQGVRVLVTGAGGFIGSHLCERLVEAGATVRAMVRYNSRNDPGLLRYLAPSTRAALEVVTGDLRDTEAVHQAVSGCEVVFHLGALIAIPYSYRHPREVVEVNILGTLNVLEAVRQLGVRRLVHTSTSEVYGTAQSARINEHHALHGQSPYAATKIGADKLVESFYCSYALPAVTIRPFNTYGPRQSGRAVIPTIVAQTLWGKALTLGALDTLRDFTFVTDTVDGMLCAATAPGVEGETCNLGTDTEVSIRQLVERVGALLHRTLPLQVDTARLRPAASEVQRLRSDNTRARERLGWQPVVDLDTGLHRVIAWVEAHPELYHWERYEV